MTSIEKKPESSSLGSMIINFRFIILIAVALITFFFIYGATQRLSIQILLEEMLPPNHEFIQLHAEYEESYGGTSTILVAIAVERGDIFRPDVLEKIKRVNDAILFHEDVRRAFVYSMAQRKSKVAKGMGSGSVDVSALMWPEVDTSPEGIARLKENIFTSDLYNGVYVSRDGKAALIMADCWPDIDYASFFNFIQELKAEEEDENTSIHVAGRPMLLGWIFHFMPTTYLILGITVVFMIVILAFIFRNIIGVAVPLIACALSIIWGFGFISYLGINFNPLMIVLAILVAARAISHSVQTTRRYLEELQICGDKKKAAGATVNGLFLASLAAIITDAAGFSVLMLARIPMIQQIAFLCTFWVISILLIVAVFGPILCIYMPKPKNIKKYSFEWDKETGQPKLTATSSIFDTIAKLAVGRTNLAIIITLVVIGLAAGYSAKDLRIGDTHPGSPILWPDSVYNQDCDRINELFSDSGTDLITVIVQGSAGDIGRPEVMKRIDLYERFITHRHPETVAGSQSLVRILKTMNKEFHESDPRQLIIPDRRDLIANLMFFFHMAGDPADVSVIVQPQYEHTVIRVFLKDHKGDTLIDIIDSTREFFESQDPIPGVEFKFPAGYGGIVAGINEEIKWSRTGTLLLVFATVFIFCGIAHRSIFAAVLLCVPIGVATLVAFAYMTIKNIGLDINSLPVVAVGIGVGIDYGIYMLSRMEEEFKNTRGDWEKMAHTSLNSTGKAVFITALTVIIPALLWPLLADLRFQAEMGLLLSFFILFAMIGAMFFIPSAICFFKPKFMLKHTHLTQADIEAQEAGFGMDAVKEMTIADTISMGSSRLVKDKIAEGANVNSVTEDETPLLIKALQVTDFEQRREIIKHLLNAGANVNARDRENSAALHVAASYGFADTVKQLLDAGAKMDGEAPFKDSPVAKAIEHGNAGVLEEFINRGYPVDMEAIKHVVEKAGYGNRHIAELFIKLFIQKKVDFLQKDESGMTALEYLKSTGRFSGLVQLIDKMMKK